MTALSEYARLESTGLWRPSAAEERRDVVVSVGDASLVISDMSDRALTHWSLPAVERLNPGQRPALYAPGADAEDELELDDDTMIEAIERVRRVVARRRPRRGRLRGVLLVSAFAALAAAAVFWLPDALIRHTVSVVPYAARAAIGERMLDDIEALAGPACDQPEPVQRLTQLRNRVLGPGRGRLVVLRDGLAETAHLPGGMILLNRALVEDHDGPEPVAGYLLAEDLRRQQLDPLQRLLEAAGPVTAFRLLTTGEISDEVLRNRARALLATPPAPVAETALLDRFDAADVSTRPYALAIDPSGAATADLIEADPRPEGEARPILSDSAWVMLQGICGD